MMIKSISYLLVVLAASCSTKPTEQKAGDMTLINYSVQNALPHDTKAFTQGLVVHKGQLYESTGEKDSWVGIVDVKTGIAARKVELGDEYFGEGITILNNKVYHLTWKTQVGFVYDLRTFQELRQFKYNTEGWGLTHDGTHLIMSAGTDKLYYLDTVNFSLVKTVDVRHNGEPLTMLNELEFVRGYIFANVWQTDLIARIDPSSGEVKGFLNLAALSTQARVRNASSEVLNGIAWHESTQSMLVTGKNWPYVFVLKLQEEAAQ